MADGPNLEQRAAQARRAYWHEQYEQALSARDLEAASSALRFVQEYDALLELMACRKAAAAAERR